LITFPVNMTGLAKAFCAGLLTWPGNPEGNENRRHSPRKRSEQFRPAIVFDLRDHDERDEHFFSRLQVS
jgi:hypothetical protein